MKRQTTYLALAVTGLTSTWYHNLQFMFETGSLSILDFINACLVNHAASSIAWDVSIAAATFLTWSYVEARRLQMRGWIAIPFLTLGVALAFAFPFFLWMRERHLRGATGTG